MIGLKRIKISQHYGIILFNIVDSNGRLTMVSNDRVKVNSSDQVCDQAENIEKIIKFCKNPKTRSEIQEFIGSYSFY